MSSVIPSENHMKYTQTCLHITVMTYHDMSHKNDGVFRRQRRISRYTFRPYPTSIKGKGSSQSETIVDVSTPRPLYRRRLPSGAILVLRDHIKFSQ